MPGVPSGRGCEGCRKQKKKCDEARPSCSRCTRLHIVYVGSGQQRYKFMGQLPGPSAGSDKGQVTKLSARPKDGYPFPTVRPSNELTLLVRSFIDTIGVSTDLRYNLAWSYGAFLEMVPQRLGKNESLDASVRALISAHRYFCCRRESITEALTKYSWALSTLRICLDDSAQARTSEILCSVYLLLICQGLLRACDGRWTGHGEGAAQMLKARGYYYKPQDSFESQLLLSLRGAVLFEGLFNDNIRMNSWEWKTMIENELDGVSHEGRMMRCLARYPDLMRRGKYICKGKKGYPELLEELSAHHRTLKAILAELQQRLALIEGLIANGVAKSVVVVQTHSHYQRSYGVCLVICIISSCVLNAVDMEDTQLVSESIYFSKEILALAEAAAIYRPLGDVYVELCLIAAWVGTTDYSIRKMAGEKMAEYQLDHAHGQAMVPREELERLSRQLRLLDPDPC